LVERGLVILSPTQCLSGFSHFVILKKRELKMVWMTWRAISARRYPQRPKLVLCQRLGLTAQVEIESKIAAKLNAVHHILVSSAEFQALSTRGLIGSSCTAPPWWETDKAHARRGHAARPPTRGSHSSAVELNLSRFWQIIHLKHPIVPHDTP